MKKFDLTSKEGLTEVGSFLLKSGFGRLNSIICPPSFGTLLIEKLIDVFFGKGPEAIEQNRGKVIEDLIRRGKEQGVGEMEIETNDTTGLKFNLPMEDENVKIETVVGADRKTRIKVRYK